MLATAGGVESGGGHAEQEADLKAILRKAAFPLWGDSNHLPCCSG